MNSKLVCLAIFLTLFFDWKVQACLLDSTCLPSQLCEINFPSPIGRCVDGAKEGEICIRDRACESKRCTFFRCQKRIAVKNGPCKKSADCLNSQYCDDIHGRSDLRQCMDRKAVGSCRKDSQCLSDKCSWLFRCTN